MLKITFHKYYQPRNTHRRALWAKIPLIVVHDNQWALSVTLWLTLYLSGSNLWLTLSLWLLLTLTHPGPLRLFPSLSGSVLLFRCLSPAHSVTVTLAHHNSLWLFRLTLSHPWLSLSLALSGAQWTWSARYVIAPAYQALICIRTGWSLKTANCNFFLTDPKMSKIPITQWLFEETI